MRARYLLADRVGSGGMGSVWRAWDRRDRRWVAVKMVTGDRTDQADRLARFVRERGLRIRHRHVVAPGLGEGGSRTMFSMDLVRGGTLEQLLARHGALPDAYVRVLLDQVLQALTAVHAAGVVHRDVKPANLLLEPTGSGRPWLRLADFGIAASAGPTGPTEGPPAGGSGTGPFRAPEAGTSTVAAPGQDLYAVGVVGLRLLAGPGRGRPPTAPGPLGVWLCSLSDSDPGRRPASAAEALGQLRALGVPSGAPWQRDGTPPEVPDLLGRPPSVHPCAEAAACFAGAAALGAVGAVGAALLR